MVFLTEKGQLEMLMQMDLGLPLTFSGFPEKEKGKKVG